MSGSSTDGIFPPERQELRRRRRQRTSFVALALVSLLLTSCSALNIGTAQTALVDHRDVIVHGGTPAGVAAAVAAADAGARVTLLVEGDTVGGMMSNGISASDIGSPHAVQGVAAEFFRRVRAHYDDRKTWRFEPHVAERILRNMLTERRVDVRFHAPILRVDQARGRITCVAVPARAALQQADSQPSSAEQLLCADSFVDAGYTSELSAAAGVPHRLGMADLHAYGETLAEQRHWSSLVQAPAGEKADAAAAFTAHPFVRTSAQLPPYAGAYAQGMPSLTYRLCVTPDAARQVAFQRSKSYASLLPSFRYFARSMTDKVHRKSNGTLYSDAYQLAVLPDGKYDLNSGYKSFTNVPAPADYLDSQASRDYWNNVLRGYVESFYYFVQHDPSVPREVQRQFANFGLCNDEFADNGHWPKQPYVREARRIEGRYTITQRDIFTHREKASAIALGSYNVDGKLSQLVNVGGTLYRDTSVHSTAPVYDIPYAAMVPKAGSVVNLLVPVGVSASPTAYGTLRMEPQYMAMGQAAGAAAALGARHDRTLAHLPVEWVQKALRAEGVVYRTKQVCRRTPQVFRETAGFSADCSSVLAVAPRDAGHAAGEARKT